MTTANLEIRQAAATQPAQFSDSPGLLAYCMTADSKLMQRMQRSIESQLELAPNCYGGCTIDRVLVTNVSPDALPEPIRAFFRDKIICCDPFVADEGGQAFFCLSRFRNASIAYALESDCQWMMLCDSDTIVVGLNGAFPPSGYGVPNVYWQKHPGETISESLSAIERGKDSAYSQGNSWFIMSRVCMEKLRFNENFHGYGCEDIEFGLRVQTSGYRLTPTDCVVVHSYHSHEDRAIDEKAFARNENILEVTRAYLQDGGSPYEPLDVELLYLVHRDWASHLAFVPIQQRFYHLTRKKWATGARLEWAIALEFEGDTSYFTPSDEGEWVHVSGWSAPPAR